ncbi:ABC transporter, permease protein, partial [gut metagenome]
MSVHYDGKDVSATLNIIPDPKAFKDFMTFHPQTRDSADKLTNDGALVPIKTAQKLNIGVGDELTFKTSEYNRTVKIKVAGIYEQYTGHEIYITKDTFNKTGIKEAPVCSILLKNAQTDPEFENDLGAKIMNNKDIRSVSFYSSVIENFLNMISSIKVIVIVLVVSAALLAFVVLYNLSNVNISERMREIATIKVLGFKRKRSQCLCQSRNDYPCFNRKFDR